jgi:hypothetical protein
MWNRILAIVAFLLASIPATLADGRPDSARCMGYGEAKAAHRGAYLHWHRGTHGRRCWGVRGRNGNKAFVQIDPNVLASNRTIEPAVQIVQTVQHPSWAWDERARLIDQPRLRNREPWVQLARFEASYEAAGAVIFSTFHGEAPDVWPEMETAAPWLRVAAGFLLVMVLWGAWVTLRPVWRALTVAGVRPSSSR